MIICVGPFRTTLADTLEQINCTVQCSSSNAFLRWSLIDGSINNGSEHKGYMVSDSFVCGASISTYLLFLKVCANC